MNSPIRGLVLEALGGRGLRADRAFWGFKILGQDASPAIPDLVRVAEGGERWGGEGATAALGYLGKDALPPLLALAANGGSKFRVEALSAIGEMHYLGTNAHPAVLFLIRSLEDREWGSAAADNLGRLGLESDISVPALAGCMQSTNQTLRMVAVFSLGRFGERAQVAVPGLLKVLDDSDFDVRNQATNALRQSAPEVLEKMGER